MKRHLEILRDRRLTLRQRFVLLVLDYRIGRGASCWPTDAELSRDAGMGRSAISEVLAELQAMGLTVHKQERPPGEDRKGRVIYLEPADAWDAILARSKAS